MSLGWILRAAACLLTGRPAAVGACGLSTVAPARRSSAATITAKVLVAPVAVAALAACSGAPSPAPPPPSPPVSSAARSSSAGTPATTLSSGPPSVGSVLVAPAPSGPVTAAQLGSPEAAASTWLSRWCAFDWRTPLGTRENLAHPAMTERAWLNFDPLTAPTSAKAWAAIVAAHQSAVCSTPVALVSPEAPRSATGAYVIVTAQRVVNTPGAAPVVEQVRETRQVLLREGRWLVDIAANGAG